MRLAALRKNPVSTHFSIGMQTYRIMHILTKESKNLFFCQFFSIQRAKKAESRVISLTGLTDSQNFVSPVNILRDFADKIDKY